jgi:hypothetical protein
MLQVFYTDVTKIDQDVTYVSMVVYVCCKRLFPMFHLFLDVFSKCVYLDISYVSHICCKCLSGCCVYLQWFLSVFPNVSDLCFKCFICLQTYVASIVSRCFKNRSGYCTWDARGDASYPCMSARLWRRLGSTGPAWARETQAQVGTCWHAGMGTPAAPISISSQLTVRQTHSPPLLNSLPLSWRV